MKILILIILKLKAIQRQFVLDDKPGGAHKAQHSPQKKFYDKSFIMNDDVFN